MAKFEEDFLRDLAGFVFQTPVRAKKSRPEQAIQLQCR